VILPRTIAATLHHPAAKSPRELSLSRCPFGRREFHIALQQFSAHAQMMDATTAARAAEIAKSR
jgi:hypothetical protein